MKKGKYRTFKQIEGKGMITVECPHCKGYFGLMARFAELMGDLLYHYNCPYCGGHYSLKKD